MPNIWEDVFEGKVEPWETLGSHVRQREEYIVDCRGWEERRQHFEQSLSGEQREELDKLLRDNIQLSHYEIRQAFVDGARFGAQCAACLFAPS